MKNEDLLTKEGRALDFGAGIGRDAFSLAEMGYTVDAVDKDTKLIVKTISEIPHEENSFISRINVVQDHLSYFPTPPGTYQVIICTNVLPFIPDKVETKKLIIKMVGGLISGGVLYFTLFGPKDDWIYRKDMSFFDIDEILSLLNDLPLKIYERSTTEGYVKTMKGKIKYAHVHRFICVRR